MDRTTKIILAIVAAVLLLCACGCVVAFLLLNSAGQFLEQSAVSDPAEVAAIGDNIAEYEVPPSYSDQFGMSLFGFYLVGYAKDTDHSLILMMQFPDFAGLDQADMEQQMRQAIQQQTNTGDLELQPVDQTTVTIRDQEVTLTVSEGTDSSGEAVRQLTGVFQGRNGATLLMILGQIDTWDQAAVDSFLASIR